MNSETTKMCSTFVSPLTCDPVLNDDGASPEYYRCSPIVDVITVQDLHARMTTRPTEESAAGVSSSSVQLTIDEFDRLWWLRYRNILTSWMMEVWMHEKYQTLSYHISLAYLEEILHQKRYDTTQLQLVAIACMYIAIKYEEVRIPNIFEMVQLADGTYTAQQLREMEIEVLNMLNWKLHRCTWLHFAFYFFGRGVLFVEDTIGDQPLTDAIVPQMYRHIQTLANFCVHHYNVLHDHAARQMAAAFIYASRKTLRVSPPWNRQLTVLTAYTEAELGDCLTSINTHCPDPVSL